MKKILYTTIAFFTACQFVFLLAPAQVFAEAQNQTDPGPLFNTILNYGLSEVGSDAYGLSNPNNPKTLSLIVADGIQILLTFLGIIFLALIVYAGFLWMGAGGNSDQTGKARGLIFNGIIGLLIVLSAYSITFFVIRNLVVVTQQSDAIQPDVNVN